MALWSQHTWLRSGLAPGSTSSSNPAGTLTSPGMDVLKPLVTTRSALLALAHSMSALTEGAEYSNMRICLVCL